MHSLTKTPVTRGAAESILAAHFGSAAKLSQYEELTEGFYNAAYLLALENGEKYVIKIAPPETVRVLRYEKGIMKTEVVVLGMVKAQTEMPVPGVHCYDATHRLIDNEYYIMDYVPGMPLHLLRKDLSADEQYAIDHQTGEWLRQVNAIQGPGFGPLAWDGGLARTWRSGFERLLDDVLLDGQEYPVSLPMPYPELAEYIKGAFACLEEVSQPCLVHWDLWDGNIFVDPGSKQITGVLDFERALWADPIMEVNFGAFGENPAFLAGYGRDMLDTPAKRQRRTLYNIYLFLIMVIECSYRQYATNDQENWSRIKLKENLDRLFTAD